jgi:hypothetical protein
VERLWGVLQDRLSSELRLAKAPDLASANTVLRKFIADYNRRFARQARQTATAWRPTPKSLERICCFVQERVVSNGLKASQKGRYIQALATRPSDRQYRSHANRRGRSSISHFGLSLPNRIPGSHFQRANL